MVILTGVIVAYDDNILCSLSPRLCKKYNIAPLPVTFKNNGKIYYDKINTSAEHFTSVDCKEVPTVQPEAYFDAIERAYYYGYTSVYIACPHSSYYPHYHNAQLAYKHIEENTDFLKKDFCIYIIDTKLFSIGTEIEAMNIAKNYFSCGCSSSVIYRDSCDNMLSAKTIFLTRENTLSVTTDGELCAYSVSGNTVTQIDISLSSDEIKYDLFSNFICKLIKVNNYDFSFSCGINCEFAGNIIGRIYKCIEARADCVTQYGISSQAIMGTGTLLVHLYHNIATI